MERQATGVGVQVKKEEIKKIKSIWNDITSQDIEANKKECSDFLDQGLLDIAGIKRIVKLSVEDYNFFLPFFFVLYDTKYSINGQDLLKTNRWGNSGRCHNGVEVFIDRDPLWVALTEPLIRIVCSRIWRHRIKYEDLLKMCEEYRIVPEGGDAR